MYTAETTLTVLPRLGEKQGKALAAMGIHTLGDLLAHVPSRYLDFSKFSYIQDLTPGEVVTVRGRLTSIAARFSYASRKMLTEATLQDQTGKLRLVWFNQGYVADALEKGEEVLVSGKVQLYKDRLHLINPIYEKVTAEHIHTGRLVPVYKLADGLYPKTFRTWIHFALQHIDELPDLLPQPVQNQYGLDSYLRTIRELHFPSNPEAVTRAQQRLAFTESFIQQVAIAQHAKLLTQLSAPSIPAQIKARARLIQKLPFTLTEGQQTALAEISHDLQHKHPMYRLLQGDVGSGKTIVALLAAISVIHEGYQVLLLAPTEILAKQHFQSITHTLHHLGQNVSTALYTRSFREDSQGNTYTKAQLTKQLVAGQHQFIIGTHALLQDNIRFHAVALVIIDEQHRFGVRQRASTLDPVKNTGSRTEGWVPHLLSMTATPIPRTAALALFGDLAVSTIPEPPKERQAIKTWVIPEHKRPGAYDFIRTEVGKGRQAFIVTPLVEESDSLEAKAAKAEYARLQTDVFPDLTLGLVYGTMKGTEKDTAMQAFAAGTTHVLVATSVIEIGIDIPNATVMLIENADRFGLAQLHQLRGRVGRGSEQAYCFLFSTAASSQERLAYFAKTANGFALAEYDMHTRGFGSLFGELQTGFAFAYGQYLTLAILEQTKTAAQELLAEDPHLAHHPLLKQKMETLAALVHQE